MRTSCKPRESKMVSEPSLPIHADIPSFLPGVHAPHSMLVMPRSATAGWLSAGVSLDLRMLQSLPGNLTFG